MTKVSPSQKILSEIELFLEAGKPEDARVLLAFLDQDTLDRRSRLRLLLVNVMLDGAAAYKDEIDQLADISDLVGTENDLVERILFEARKSPDPSAGKARLRVKRDAPTADRLESLSNVDRQSRESAQFPHDREIELAASREAVRALERQVGELQALLEERDAYLKVIEPEVKRLTEELAQLYQTKDGEIAVLHEELARKTDMFRASEAALVEERERLAEQISSLKTQVGEAQRLLSARDGELASVKTRIAELTQETGRIGALESQLANAGDLIMAREGEIDSLKARVADLAHETERMAVLEAQLDETKRFLAERSAEVDMLASSLADLNQEKADLASEWEMAERKMQQQLGEQIGLLQVMESSIGEIETQMGEQIRLLERQLSDKQDLLEHSRAEMSELRNQICVLNQRVAEADAAKLRSESLLAQVGKETGRDWLTTRFSGTGAHAVGEPGPVETTPLDRHDAGSSRLNRSLRPLRVQWNAISFPRSVLPAAAVGLLLLPVGYILLGHTVTAPVPNASIRWENGFQTSGVTEGETDISKFGDDGERKDPPANAARPADSRTRKPDVAKVRDVPGDNDGRYVTRRAVALRDQPRYAARAKAEIGAGTSVSVLSEQGSWLRVKTRQSGAVGYVRKEYLVLASSAR